MAFTSLRKRYKNVFNFLDLQVVHAPSKPDGGGATVFSDVYSATV
jgi:hypothetical protein